MPEDVGKGGQDNGAAPPGITAIEAISDGTDALVPSSVSGTTVILPENQRAVEGYLGGQLADRSKDNAADALRRLARVITGSTDVVPAQIPWTAIDYEAATRIRTRLYELTREGAITPGTANLTLSHLRGLLRAMWGMKLITDGQLGLVTAKVLKNVPGRRTPRGRALTLREEQSLRAAARSLEGYRGPMLDTAMVLAIGGGLRREEVSGLPVGALHPDTIVVLGKGNVERAVPLTSEVRDIADEWLEVRLRLIPHDGLFCAPQRPVKALTPWMFWSLVRTVSHEAFGDRKPCGDKCKCLKVVTGPHDFRRTFATRLLDQGLDIRQVQVLMGHASPETTARYDKRDLETLFEKCRNMRIIA